MYHIDCKSTQTRSICERPIPPQPPFFENCDLNI